MKLDNPTLHDIRSTVERMEATLRDQPDRVVRQQFRLYADLITRFEADLPSERERLLSRAAALMLIQAWMRTTAPS